MNNLTAAQLSDLMWNGTLDASASPRKIEEQEAQGQIDFVKSALLPKKIKSKAVTRRHLEELGFIFGKDVDDLFSSAIFPPGWRKVATTHHMWSEIRDEKNRVRAGVFYKAAFYDRNADISLNRRYVIDVYHINEDGRLETVVLDDGNVIRGFGTRPNKYSPETCVLGYEQEKKAIAWLAENYPDYQNPLAYWD